MDVQRCVRVGTAVGDALGDTLGDALGDAVGDALRVAFDGVLTLDLIFMMTNALIQTENMTSYYFLLRLIKLLLS